jgi:predicted Zn finger-like uncharacterized protein
MENTSQVTVTCPTCGTRYRVPTEVVSAQKAIRCRRCVATFVGTKSTPPKIRTGTPVNEDQILAWLSQPDAEEQSP